MSFFFLFFFLFFFFFQNAGSQFSFKFLKNVKETAEIFAEELNGGSTQIETNLTATGPRIGVTVEQRQLDCYEDRTLSVRQWCKSARPQGARPAPTS